MSASPETQVSRLKGLEEIRVDKIHKNPANPRIWFPPEEMARLMESIDRKGILVPVVVYKQGQRYVLTDGERRWRCAKELGLETVPAVITVAPDAEENLIQMFNIHMVRESWKDMPTAKALGQVVQDSGVADNNTLSDMTGLSVERIRRLRHALELPKEYQDYIDEGRIPMNFFWELKRSVIDPLAKRRPALAAEFGESGVLDAFVEKRLEDVITDVVSLRMITPIINYAARDVEDPAESSPLDDTLRALIEDSATTIQDAYEDTVQVVFETEKLQRRADNVVKSFERLMSKARSGEELSFVRQVGKDLAKRIVAAIR
jgi:ParB family transcriptional regulator, chromosome partitioning protein